MGRLLISAILGTVLAVGLTAQILGEDQSAGAYQAPLIFAVNLWSAPVDIQLGDLARYSVANLPVSAPSTLHKLESPVPLRLFYKPSQDRIWRCFRDQQGQPFEFSFQAGTTYLIRVGTDGLVTVLAMKHESSSAAQLTILNNSGGTLGEVILWSEASQAVLQARQLPNQAFTEFSGVAAGKYGLSWTQAETRQFLPGTQSGTVGLVGMQGGSWYVFIVSKATAAAGGTTPDHGQIWDVSPLEDPVQAHQ